MPTDPALMSFFETLAQRDLTSMDGEYEAMVSEVLSLLASYCTHHPLATVDFCIEVTSGAQARLAKAKQQGTRH